MTARDLILIVDDEPRIQAALADILDLADHPTLAAGDGREALALYARHHAEIGLVILDLMMPVMDGAEALRALRDLDPTVKVILCTGLDHVEAHHRLAVSAGNEKPSAFIQKPYSVETLINTVQVLLAEHGGQ